MANFSSSPLFLNLIKLNSSFPTECIECIIVGILPTQIPMLYPQTPTVLIPAIEKFKVPCIVPSGCLLEPFHVILNAVAL